MNGGMNNLGSNMRGGEEDYYNRLIQQRDEMENFEKCKYCKNRITQ